MADLFSRQLLAGGFNPKSIADERRMREQQNALSGILNQQAIEQNKAVLRGTQLDNTQRARQMARPNTIDPYKQAQIDNLKQQMKLRETEATKPELTPLQKQMETITGVSFSELTPEQRREAYTFIKSGGQSGDSVASRRLELDREKWEAEQANPKQPKRSAAQTDAEGFYDRMVKSNQELERITGRATPEDTTDDYSPTGTIEQARGVFNATSSKEMQQYRQAANNWIRANLRKESGAAIGADEMTQEFATYFPQFGDSDEVIQQKARARATTEAAMKKAAGLTDSGNISGMSDEDLLNF